MNKYYYFVWGEREREMKDFDKHNVLDIKNNNV